jgi:hypothetical protein
MVHPVRPVGPTTSLEKEGHAERRSGAGESGRHATFAAAIVQLSHGSLVRHTVSHADRHVSGDVRRRSIDSRASANAEARRTHDAVKRGAALAARAQANTSPERVAQLLAD